MVQVVMIIVGLAIMLSLGWMIKRPQEGMYLYKGGLFIIMVIVLFFALFFYLGSNGDANALNTNLHPWKNFILPRVIGAFICVAFIYGISQIPMIFIKSLDRTKKHYIMKYESLVYAVILTVGIFFLSKCSGVGELYDSKLQAGNEVVRLLNEYNNTHKNQCESLAELGFQPAKDNFYEYKGMWFSINTNDKTYDLRFRSPDGDETNYDFTYTKDTDSWNESIIW